MGVQIIEFRVPVVGNVEDIRILVENNGRKIARMLETQCAISGISPVRITHAGYTLMPRMRLPRLQIDTEQLSIGLGGDYE